MKIWVDADAAPAEMKDVILRAGKRLGVDVVLVANQSLLIPVAYPQARSVCVATKSDAADHFISENSEAGDIAVTADIALAAVLVKKSVVTLDPRGAEYSVNDADARLSLRNFQEELRGAGVRTGGPKPYGAKEKKAFAEAFDRVQTKALRKR